jgi:hypothetical protein
MSKLPGFGLSSEGPNRLAVAVHFGRLEDRNAPRMGLAAISPRISNAIHVKRYTRVIRQR